MALAPGSQLGPYEVVAPLGAGGMGEVYRARDPRLGREVALKVLPEAHSADPDRLSRFEREARAASALSHPNVLEIFDVGEHEGRRYVVTELIEGETLRKLLESGALPLRKARSYAGQIAAGLAAAYDAGVVHRDLKPENLLITGDQRVKILDFGLAKLLERDPLAALHSAAETATVVSETDPGTIMGTVGYISPEQIRGELADHRSDIFSFGVVLYEMLCGRRPFVGDSSVEILNAILKEEPIEPGTHRPELPPEVERIVMHCLEKRPGDRFQSARDLAFHLEGLSKPSGQLRAQALTTPRRIRIRVAALAVLAGVPLAGAVSFYLGKRAATLPLPSFERITFRAGMLTSGFFSADGETILYSAAWDGRPNEAFMARVGTRESRPLDLPLTRVLSVSRTGEMALLLHRERSIWNGTLARAPMTGGAPRELAVDVLDADWTPDGSQLAVLRVRPGRPSVVEFPMGNPIVEALAWRLRVSRRGDRIALLEGVGSGVGVGKVVIRDRSGQQIAASSVWQGLFSLAWTPEGDEVWFSGTRGDEGHPAIRAVSLSSEERLVVRVPHWLFLQDISPDGRVLLSANTRRAGIRCRPPGETQERELGWHDFSLATALSADGSTLLFGEGRAWSAGVSAAASASRSVYIRTTDGAPAARLGDGAPHGLSPDGRWVLATVDGTAWTLLPTGPGTPRTLPSGTVRSRWFGRWLDEHRVVFMGSGEGRTFRIYVQDVETGAIRPIAPEGVVRPEPGFDPGWVLALSDTQWALYPVDGGDPRPIPHLTPADAPVQWGPKGQVLYVRPAGESPSVEISRVDLSNGRREPHLVLSVSDPTGIESVGPIVMTPDGESYCYTYVRSLGSMYLAEGLR